MNDEKFEFNGKEEIVEIWKPCGDLLLEPCPFCGGDAIYIQYSSPVGMRWRVTCCECLATIDPGYAQARNIVQEKWNRRILDIKKG